jgi:hypothetical protein
MKEVWKGKFLIKAIAGGDWGMQLVETVWWYCMKWIASDSLSNRDEVGTG